MHGSANTARDDAIAVMFQLVAPAGTGRRLRAHDRDCRQDEPLGLGAAPSRSGFRMPSHQDFGLARITALILNVANLQRARKQKWNTHISHLGCLVLWIVWKTPEKTEITFWTSEGLGSVRATFGNRLQAATSRGMPVPWSHPVGARTRRGCRSRGGSGQAQLATNEAPTPRRGKFSARPKIARDFKKSGRSFRLAACTELNHWAHVCEDSKCPVERHRR